MLNDKLSPVLPVALGVLKTDNMETGNLAPTTGRSQTPATVATATAVDVAAVEDLED